MTKTSVMADELPDLHREGSGLMQAGSPAIRVGLSTTDAAVGNPSQVFEPVARALAGRQSARRRTPIVIYRYTGRQWFFRVPSAWCRECDALVAVVEQAIRELGIERAVDLKIRPWWIFWWLPLLAHGAWHAPILVVNGRVFSQGVAPDKETLKAYLAREVTR